MFKPKIAREVHDLEHRKLRKRKLRGRKLRGHGVFAKYQYLVKLRSIVLPARLLNNQYSQLIHKLDMFTTCCKTFRYLII